MRDSKLSQQSVAMYLESVKEEYVHYVTLLSAAPLKSAYSALEYLPRRYKEYRPSKPMQPRSTFSPPINKPTDLQIAYITEVSLLQSTNQPIYRSRTSRK